MKAEVKKLVKRQLFEAVKIKQIQLQRSNVVQDNGGFRIQTEGIGLEKNNRAFEKGGKDKSDWRHRETVRQNEVTVK